MKISKIIEKLNTITELRVDYEPHDYTSGTLIVDMDDDTVIEPKMLIHPNIKKIRTYQYGIYLDVENIVDDVSED